MVLVELDGAPWRRVPDEVALRTGLRPGLELDRQRLRLLRRELRRVEALQAAGRALAARDLSERRLAERLRRAGATPAAGREAVEALARAGLVDDERLASRRAAVLAARGKGDAAVRWELEREGIAPALVERALAELEPEAARASALAAARGGGVAAARYLLRRGFSGDSVEAAVGTFAVEDEAR